MRHADIPAGGALLNAARHVIVVFTFLAAAMSAGCAKAPAYSRAESVMGTDVVITVLDAQTQHQAVKAAVGEAFAEFKRIDVLMSCYRQDSEVSGINRLKAAESIRVSERTMEVLRRSREFSVLTDGAFDITVMPLMQLWGFYGAGALEEEPSEEEIKAALKVVGYEKVSLGEGNSVTKSADGVKIDLGGIAAGYAIDRAVGILKSHGINSALIEAGGDIFCLGHKPGNKPWRIAIRHPRQRQKVIAVLELEDRAVATSGDYENYFVIGKTRYSHIIDPRSGYPKGDLPASVTVVAKDAVTTDGLSTALFVMGAEEGMKLVENMPEVEAVIIDEERGVASLQAERALGGLRPTVSSGLKGRIKFVRD